MKNLYLEKQKLRQWWIWVIPIGLMLFTIYGALQQLIFEVEFGSKPMTTLGLIVFTISVLGFAYFLYHMTLITEINKVEIKMRYMPFTKKIVKWSDIKSAKIVNYGFVGYGIRLGSKYGTVYNTKGNIGLAIELKSGKKFVIGTQ